MSILPPFPLDLPQKPFMPADPLAGANGDGDRDDRDGGRHRASVHQPP